MATKSLYRGIPCKKFKLSKHRWKAYIQKKFLNVFLMEQDPINAPLAKDRYELIKSFKSI